MYCKIRLFTICLHFNYLFVLPETLSAKSMSRGKLHFRKSPGFTEFIPMAHRLQNRNPHGRYALSHLPYNPACILHHLQSDRLLQWLWNHLAHLPDKEKLQASHIRQALLPAICRTSFFLIVIYASCPILLSLLIDSENTWILIPKKEIDWGSISSSGNVNTACSRYAVW